MKDTIYYKQAELLLRVLPYINSENVFVLKGGTAINFFVRELPRISVDIDLAYVPVNEREAALTDISKTLENISTNIRQAFQDCSINLKRIQRSKIIRAMIISVNDITVKIEANLVLRGTIYNPEVMDLCQEAQNIFEMSITSKVLSFAELYGGKICAALDRQHPRDLFDIHLLLNNEGINEKIRKAFIVYLISHPRPVVEILNPNFIDIRQIFENEFKGMTKIEVKLDELLETRKSLVTRIKNSLTVDEKKFLISVKMNKPEWELLDLKGVENLPAVKWKLLNLQKMEKMKHKKALEKLRNYLEI